MSKSSHYKEIGMSPFEENIFENCYDKDKSDNKAHLSTTDFGSLEGIDHRDYMNDFKCGDFHSSLLGKKTSSYDVFPSLRSHILMYLKNYFFKTPGPRKYDYYLELLYDEFRAEKLEHKAEGKWNVKGLLEFLNKLDVQEYLQNLKEPPPMARAKECDPVLTEEFDLEEYEEYLCNISHGMTLEEYRALNERESYYEYWPGSKDFPSKVKDREPDVAKEESKVIRKVDLELNQKVEEDKSFGAQDEKDNMPKKNSKKKKKKGSRWKRFLSCLNYFKCIKSQDESQVS